MEIEQLEKRIEQLAAELEVREGELYRMLYQLTVKKEVLTRGLIRKSGEPKLMVYRFLKSFHDILEPASRVLAVKEEVREKVCEICREKIAQIEEIDTEKLEETMKEAIGHKPKANRDYDQFFATRRTCVRRIKKMAKNGDLYKRSVAILGDDDFNSIAVAACGQAKRICVFEIDERLVKAVVKFSAERKLRIEVVRHDLRRPIGKEYLNQFDVVFTDPPYTAEGFSLFINRGIELLKKKNSSRIYTCYGNSERARERDVEIQRRLAEQGLAIRFKIHQFNKYQGAESIGSSSSLYGLDWTPKTKTIKVDYKKFYTNE